MAKTLIPKKKAIHEERAKKGTKLKLIKRKSPISPEESKFHLMGHNIFCGTESRGYATPKGSSIAELRVDASSGFIPLWQSNSILRWRFQDRSFELYENANAIKSEIRKLFSDALEAWGDALPVKFKYDEDLWDFEFVLYPEDNCNSLGCSLARSFFPDAGRHEFVIFPKLFSQIGKEQVDTFIHETGHIFGLRHFFANVKETDSPSLQWGVDSEISIMNYGDHSELTELDKTDLKRLYTSAWDGSLTEINGTPIKLVKPYSQF